MSPRKSLGKNQDDYHTALLLSASRVDELAKGLERTWVAQLLLSAGGVALILDIGGFREALRSYFNQKDPELKVTSGVILVVTIYVFMHFGQLLSAFLRVRRLHDQLLDGFQKSTALRVDLTPLKVSTSYFEGYYSKQLFGGQTPVLYMYYMATATALSVSQAASLYLIFYAYGVNPWSGALMVVASIGVFLLYVGFWRAKRLHHPNTRIFVPSCIVMIVLWCSFFHWGHPWLLAR